MKSQLFDKKIYLFLAIMLLPTSVLHAVSADFFGIDTEAGQDSLMSKISSADPTAEFFEYNFTDKETPNSIPVTGTNGSTIFVKISRDNIVHDYSYGVSHDGTFYYMDDWSVDVPQSDSGWDEAVEEGVKFEFFDEDGDPTTINAFGTFAFHWGTCCTAQDNPTPTGTAEGSSIYSVFTTASGTNSINQIGIIPSRISADVHFVAEIDDSDLFTSVTLVPNGDGEFFALGGYLLFSQVEIGSMPAGSGWTPSIAPSIVFNPEDESTGIGVSSNITLTFSETVRNTNDSELTDENVDVLIDLRSSNSNGVAIAFDATINSTKTVITINPTSDFISEQVVYVGIDATVEDSDDNAISDASATFTCAAGGVPTAFINPSDGSTDISISSDITITFDEAVRNTDNSELTGSNVDALITLKKTNSSGADITFDASINDDKMVITIEPSEEFTPNQVVYVEISAVEDVSNNATTASNATFTTSANTPPIVSGIPDQTVNEGDSFSSISLDQYVTDAATESNLMSWAATGQSNLTVIITSNVATISAANNWHGSEEITFIAIDNDEINRMAGSDVATFTAIKTNDPPVFTSTAINSATEDQAYSYTMTASDVDEGDILTFSTNTLPTWLEFDDTATISGTPENDDVGDHAIVLTVSDQDGETDQQSFTITVINTNNAPVFSTPTNTSDEDVAFSSTIIATDIDVGDELTFAAITLPSWLEFDSLTQVLSGTPTNDDVGDHPVKLIVSDGEATDILEITFEVVNINDLPVLDTPMTAAIGNVGGGIPYSHTFSASDVDAGDDTFTFTINVPLPDWLSFNENTGVLSGTPTDADAGNYTITVTITDGTGASVDTSFTITVHVGVTNTAPTFSSDATTAAVTTASEDAEYIYSMTAADPDTGSVSPAFGDVITLSATTLPTWLIFNTETGILSGTPTNDDVGDHSVVLSVIDAFGAEATQSFTITVANTNDPPVSTSMAITEAIEDAVYSYTVTAKDIDVGDTFSFAATTLPTWLEFDGTATISGTPTNDNVGANPVMLTVSDGTATVEMPFTLTVANTNDPPSTFDLTSPLGVTLTDDIINFKWHFSEDVDIDDILNYIIYIEGTNSFYSDSLEETNTHSISALDLINIASATDFTFSAIHGDLILELDWYVAVSDNIITTYSDTSTFKISMTNLVVDELEINDIVLPNEYNLLNPYPNPFNPVTIIKYVTPESGQISINIYDIHGREVAKLYNGIQMPGSHSLTWDASEYSSGIYFVTMLARLKGKQAGAYINTQKLMLIK